MYNIAQYTKMHSAIFFSVWALFKGMFSSTGAWRLHVLFLCLVLVAWLPVTQDRRSDDSLGDAVGITVRRRSPVLQITLSVLAHLTTQRNHIKQVAHASGYTLPLAILAGQSYTIKTTTFKLELQVLAVDGTERAHTINATSSSLSASTSKQRHRIIKSMWNFTNIGTPNTHIMSIIIIKHTCT